MWRGMKPITALFCMALLSLTCSAFSWTSVFGTGTDVAENTAKAIESGNVASVIPKADSDDHKSTNDKRTSVRSAQSSTDKRSRKAYVEDLSATTEKPLPEEKALPQIGDGEEIIEGSRHVAESKSSMAGVEEEFARRALRQGTADPEILESSHAIENLHERRAGDKPEETYSNLKKEIQDINKHLGPEELPQMEQSSHVEHETTIGGHPAELGKPKEEHHSATITKGIEQAIVGLTNVYKVLQKSDVKEPSVAGSDSAPRESRDVGFRDRAMWRTANSTALPSPSESPDNSPANTNGTDSHSTVENAESNVADVSGKVASGVSMFAVIAGFVFIGAVALMVTGYARSHQDSQAQHTPLYPPRGPSFV